MQEVIIRIVEMAMALVILPTVGWVLVNVIRLRERMIVVESDIKNAAARTERMCAKIDTIHTMVEAMDRNIVRLCEVAKVKYSEGVRQ